MLAAGLVATSLIVAQSTSASKGPFAQAIVSVSVQPASSGTYHRVSPNLKGLTTGLAISGGRWFHDQFAVEGELALGGTVSAAQRFGYTWEEIYVARNRDRFLNALVRAKLARVRLELVAGGGMAFTNAGQVDRIYRRYDYRTRTYETHPIEDEVNTMTAASWTAGVDLPLKARRHLLIVPAFRVRWVERPQPAMTGWVGISAWTFQFAVGVRGGA